MVTGSRAVTRGWRAGARWLMLALTVSSCGRGEKTGAPGAHEAVGSELRSVSLGAPPVAPALDEFAGAAACQSCHVEQFSAWRTSTHGVAGGTPGSRADGNGRVRVIAPFSGLPLRFRDATVIPLQRAGVFSFVVQRPGERDTMLTVDAVIGGGHMAGGGTQGFVTAASDGTLRFLPFDWSRQSQTWFCNTGTRTNRGWAPITAGMRLADCGDWPPTRVLGDEPRFSNCQSCHGSQIDLAFDSTTKRWNTHNNGFAINCESCHGPAARHVRLMQSGAPATADIGLASLEVLDKDQSVTLCLSCHALKARLVSRWRPGADLLQFYSIRLSQLGDQPLTADGRTRSFAYQEGHLASDCYRSGGMTCTSCHDPHSQHYRTIDGQPLPGRTDDRQCTSCHASKAADVSAHTKHREGSTGSRCVACHMASEQQHELGDAIRYGRADHSISIPRPIVDSALGITSACRQCHGAASEASHAAQVARWWGELKPHEPAVAGVIAARSVRDINAATPLLLQPESRNVTAQVAGLSEWLERFASPNMGSVPPALEPSLRALAVNPDPDVRALALATLQYVRGSDAGTRRFLQQQLDAAGDSGAPVRRRWSMVLGGLGDAARAAGDPQRATVAYRKALAVTPEQSALLLNSGLAFAELGDVPTAVQMYQQSLRQSTQQPIGHVNLGIALERGGDAVGASQAFHRAIAIDPAGALGYLNLGTSLLRQGKSAEAIPWFEKALVREPGLAVGHFQLALALLKEGQLARSAVAVRRSLALDTANAEAVKLADALREALRAGGARR